MKANLTLRPPAPAPHRWIGFTSVLLLTTLTGLAAPFGSDFTYQGRLNISGSPAADGLYDFSFALHSDATIVSPVGTPVTVALSAVRVTNGLFTVQLDFGVAAFASGEARWLQVQIATNGITPLTSLNPRQRITPTPQAIYAGSATTAATATSVAAGAVTSSGLAPGSVNGAAIADSSITTADLSGSLLSNTFWNLGGNIGTTPGGNFIGTADNQSVEIRANNFRALRLEPRGSGSPPSLVGGYHNNTAGNFGGVAIAGGGTQGSINQVAGHYAFIGAGHGGYPGHFAAVVGGAYNTSLGQFSFVGTGEANTNLGLYAAIVAGSTNTITALGDHGFIGGGQNNIANNTHATVGGGEANRATSWATVGGGRGNQGDGAYATVAGGRGNIGSGTYATVPGGSLNSATGQSSFAAGTQAKANHQGSFVWADSQAADFASLANNQFLIRAAGNVGINKPNPATALDVNGTVTATGFSGSGAGLTSVNGSQLTSGSVGGTAITDGTITAADVNAPSFNTTFWRSGGNAVGATPGANIIGTTDNQPLEVRVNGIRGFLLQPGTPSPNVVGGGFSSVAAGLNGVAIGGGQENNAASSRSTIGGGLRNSIGSGGQDSTIGGGQVNAISNNTMAATVAGGVLNTIGAGSQYAAIGGGRFNQISDGGVQSTIGGGRNNLIDANSINDTIAGGTNNLIGANSEAATIGGGSDNRATASFSTIGGGVNNTSIGSSATVGGGDHNTSSGTFSTVGGGSFNTSSGHRSTVSGGEGNTSIGIKSTVSGGVNNTSIGSSATVGGGMQNTSGGPSATVGGGELNTAGSFATTVGGGVQNTSGGSYATVPGGADNTAGGWYSFAAGQRAKANHDGSFVWADSQNANFDSTGNNQFAVRANGGVRFATLSTPDPLAALNQVVIGPNGMPDAALRLGFHGFNGISGAGVIQATEGGGSVPLRLNPLGGGVSVGGSLSVNNGVVTASSDVVEPFYVGGAAAGYALKDRVTGAAGRWVMYAANGTLAFWRAGNNQMTLDQFGNLSTVGTVNGVSDRNAKENFQPVDPRAVLDKVAALPLSEWNYKTDTATRHVGPMAQDFHAAFNVGLDDKHIATVDADGVALAAIQGLNQKLDETRAENVELKRRLEKLEQMMTGGAR